MLARKRQMGLRYRHREMPTNVNTQLFTFKEKLRQFEALYLSVLYYILLSKKSGIMKVNTAVTSRISSILITFFLHRRHHTVQHVYPYGLIPIVIFTKMTIMGGFLWLTDSLTLRAPVLFFTLDRRILKKKEQYKYHSVRGNCTMGWKSDTLQNQIQYVQVITLPQRN